MLNSSLKVLLRNASNLPPFTGRHTLYVPKLSALSTTILSLMEHDEPQRVCYGQRQNAMSALCSGKCKNNKCSYKERKITVVIYL